MILENFFLLISSLFLILAFKNEKSSFLFTPKKLFVYVSFLYLIIPGLYLINFSPKSVFWSINLDLVLLQNVCIFLFIFIFLVVYSIVKTVKIPTVNKDFNSNVIYLALFLLICSLYAKSYIYNAGAFFLEDKYSNATNLIPRHITFMNNLHLWGFMIWFVYYFRITEGNILKNKSYFYKFISICYFAITLIIPIIQGRRFGVIFPVLMLVGLSSFYRKFPIKKGIKYGLLIFFIFFIITILRLSQSKIISNDNSYNIETLFSAIDGSVMVNLLDGIVSRLGNVYIVFNRVLEYRIFYGLENSFNSFLLSFQGLIPSFIWSGKPDLSIGNTLGKELNLITWENQLTGINAGWIGEGYYNYGISGVLLAGIFYALTLGLVSKLASTNFDTGKLIFLMYFIFLVSGFQMEIAMTFNNFVKGVAVQLLLVLMFTRIPAFKLKFK